MDKVLIITGATGSLGSGIIDHLTGKDYAKIYLTGRHLDKGNNSRRISYIPTGDMTNEKSVAECFNEITVQESNLYFLFSTIGGYTGGKRLWETSFDEFEKMLKINLYSSFLIAKHFSLLVSRSKGGAICFTTSMTSLVAEKNKGVYGISKSALNYLVKTLSLEGKDINMSVNAVAPYIIDTEENRGWVKDPEQLIKPMEIGELVHKLFENFNFISGNIMELPSRLRINNY